MPTFGYDFTELGSVHDLHLVKHGHTVLGKLIEKNERLQSVASRSVVIRGSHSLFSRRIRNNIVISRPGFTWKTMNR